MRQVKVSVRIGSYVYAQGNVGRVYRIDSPQDLDRLWLDQLAIQPTTNQMLEPWYRILCQGGGEVCMPATECKVMDELEFKKKYGELKNPMESTHFEMV